MNFKTFVQLVGIKVEQLEERLRLKNAGVEPGIQFSFCTSLTLSVLKRLLLLCFSSLCFYSSWWHSQDGDGYCHFIRLLHPGGCKTLCIFSGHWWKIMELHSSLGFLVIIAPVLSAPWLLSLVAFLLLSSLTSDGKVVTAACLTELFGAKQTCADILARGVQHGDTSKVWGTPRRLVSP